LLRQYGIRVADDGETGSGTEIVIRTGRDTRGARNVSFGDAVHTVTRALPLDGLAVVQLADEVEVHHRAMTSPRGRAAIEGLVASVAELVERERIEDGILHVWLLNDGYAVHDAALVNESVTES
jgi:hypothetical protein